VRSTRVPTPSSRLDQIRGGVVGATSPLPIYAAAGRRQTVFKFSFNVPCINFETCEVDACHKLLFAVGVRGRVLVDVSPLRIYVTAGGQQTVFTFSCNVYFFVILKPVS
jgi:hypothetical protein